MKQLQELGFQNSGLLVIRAMMDAGAGIFLVAGLTGSGRTTTASAVMQEIAKNSPNSPVALENSPEYKIEGVASYAARPGDEEAWSEAVRAAMRMDPCAVLIGEIRDAESLRLAVKLAQSGTQVWSTIHANSASIAFDRMADLAPESEAQAFVKGVIWQKLTPEKHLAAKILIPNA